MRRGQKKEDFDLVDLSPRKPTLDTNFSSLFSFVDENVQDIDGIYTISRMEGYTPSFPFIVLYYILSILSCGALNLIGRWLPSLYTKFTHDISSLAHARIVLVVSNAHLTETPCPVFSVYLKGIKVSAYSYRNALFLFNEVTETFQRTASNTCQSFQELAGITKQERNFDEKIKIFGPNIIEILVKSPFALLVEEILNPFYIFQIFAILLWLYDDYYIYATTIFATSSISALFSLWETRKNLISLQTMARFHCNVSFLSFQDDFIQKETISSQDLVPGDMVEISSDFVLPCDMILYSGQCIVNESMLTGESVPVIKNAFPHESDKIYSIDDDKMYTLYSGTKVLSARNIKDKKVIGIVMRTGFQSAKGSLVLSILYPKPNQFKFYTDSIKFIGVMFVIGFLGFMYSSIQLSRLGASWGRIIIRALDIITITVPPALPIALTIGTSYAIHRLMEKKIFCISPPRINVAGMISYMCFDKTGTLTCDGLDLLCVVPILGDTFVNPITSISSLESPNSPPSFLLSALVSCQGLSILDGQLIGDPMEIQLFKASKWFLNGDVLQSNLSHRQISILKRFDFSSELARMSVIVQQDGDFHLFTKGSPEMLSNLASRIPEDYDKVLNEYAKQGYRILTIGYKKITDVKASRQELECDLTLLGMIVLENKLKLETRGAMLELKKANIQTVMITGDNALTAISVAQKCGLTSHPIYLANFDLNGNLTWKSVDDTQKSSYLDSFDQAELAMTGHVFREICTNSPESIPEWIVKCRIFARMTPDQKMRLIEEYMNLGFHVGMIGDGANDCGALKTAHLGISLSDSEASIAAPFTSRKTTIECVSDIIRDGRAALTTSLQVFKYMASFSMISFFAVVLLYQINSNLADFQFLYIDIFIILPIAFLMGKSHPSDVLVHEKPDYELFHPIVFVSLFAQIIVSWIFLMIINVDLKNQDWFVPYVPEPGFYLCSETTVIFLLSQFQVINVAMALNITEPFKKPLMHNLGLFSYTTLMYVLSLLLILLPTEGIQWLFDLVTLPFVFRVKLVVFGVMHLVICWFMERFLIIGQGRKWLKQYIM